MAFTYSIKTVKWVYTCIHARSCSSLPPSPPSLPYPVFRNVFIKVHELASFWVKNDKMVSSLGEIMLLTSDVDAGI